MHCHRLDSGRFTMYIHTLTCHEDTILLTYCIIVRELTTKEGLIS
jgi:hypothetical protein